MKRMNQWKRVFLFLVILGLCNMNSNLYVRAETVGKGARIIIYGESGSARFRLGGAVGGQVKLAAEPTGSKTLSDISFTTSDSAVCSVEKADDYWLVTRLKEGTAVIRMACRADGDVVVRTLLMSNLTFLDDGMGEFVVGSIRADATVYWGCSDVEGITSYDTEKKCNVTKDTEVDVVAKCNDFYRVELEEGTFGDTEEEWGYVKRRDVYIPMIDLSVEDMVLYEGEHAELNVQIRPEIATSREVIYQSSNTNVVAVDAGGKVSAMHKGTAVITVSGREEEEWTAKCRVTVKSYVPVTGIQVVPDKTEIEDGKSGRIRVNIVPADATVQDYEWNISDESILQVDGKGRYLARRPGTVTVSVISKEGGFTDSCRITVKEVEAEGITIQQALSLDAGETVTPVWHMVPANATNKDVIWKIEDSSIARVDKSGRITGLKQGTTVLHIQTRNGKYAAQCKLTVELYVSNIWLKNNMIHMTIGDSRKLSARIIPERRTKEKIIWRSSDSSVVSVTNEGMIKALKRGKATVMVYDRYRGAFDYGIINVKANLSRPRLQGASKSKSMKLKWKKVKRATHYAIYRYDGKGKKFKKIKEVSKKTTKYTLKNIKKNTKIRIKALYKKGSQEEYSKYSNQVVYR